MKTTQEVAQRLVELCRNGNYDQAYQELYHQDCVSIEPDFIPHNTAKGMDAIADKGKQWAENLVAMHGGHVSEPVVAKDYFSVTMGYDATFKDRGRVEEDEVAIYKVENGKIIEERFFY